tara:strand:+ start:83 stop:646 length:564 start_codon:yes stop_codon:yes gene_type:complete
MPNFQNGKIYKIVDNTNTYENYYGSTTQSLRRRKNEHKKKNNACESYKIISLNNWDIILIEEYPCSSYEELREREKYYITNFPCINKQIPNQTREEYYERNKEKIKQKTKEYNELHREEKKLYNQKNREHLALLMKQNYQLNKDRHRQAEKKWNQLNPERRKEICRLSYYSRAYWDNINKIDVDLFL